MLACLLASLREREESGRTNPLKEKGKKKKDSQTCFTSENQKTPHLFTLPSRQTRPLLLTSLGLDRHAPPTRVFQTRDRRTLSLLIDSRCALQYTHWQLHYTDSARSPPPSCAGLAWTCLSSSLCQISQLVSPPLASLSSSLLLSPTRNGRGAWAAHSLLVIKARRSPTP
ncbi:hypothetical protein LZ32DRAFT_193006 [Colletotrichum eremochloae]|nr:hypothetical protein LZ32DRAFT_193006 [Colletotrichum eremochloae]